MSFTYKVLVLVIFLIGSLSFWKSLHCVLQCIRLKTNPVQSTTVFQQLGLLTVRGFGEKKSLASLNGTIVCPDRARCEAAIVCCVWSQQLCWLWLTCPQMPLSLCLMELQRNCSVAGEIPSLWPSASLADRSAMGHSLQATLVCSLFQHFLVFQQVKRYFLVFMSKFMTTVLIP